MCEHEDDVGDGYGLSTLATYNSVNTCGRGMYFFEYHNVVTLTPYRPPVGIQQTSLILSSKAFCTL